MTLLGAQDPAVFVGIRTPDCVVPGLLLLCDAPQDGNCQVDSDATTVTRQACNAAYKARLQAS